MPRYFIGGSSRQDEVQCSQNNDWKLIKSIELSANNSSILIDTDMEGNSFNCSEVIISSKIISNTSSKPMCKINKDTVFSGVGTVYTNGTRYCYDKFKTEGFFLERDMKYSSQNILENSVLFDNGFLRIIEKEVEGINSIEYYGDSITFIFKPGTIIKVYGR